jgi:hypothetical protein
VLPSQFKRLLEILRSQATVIEKGFKEQERSVRETAHQSDESREDIPRIISRTLQDVSIKEGKYEKNQRDKEYRLQFLILVATCLTALFTALAFAAAAYYASVAKRQLDEMANATKAQIKAADAAKSAAETTKDTLNLARTQAEDTMEAICFSNFTFSDDESRPRWEILIGNSGKVSAKFFRFHAEFSRMSLPSRTISKHKQAFDITDTPEIFPEGKGRVSNFTRTVDLEGDVVPNALAFSQSREIEIVNYSMSYDNGFGTPKPIRGCYANMKNELFENQTHSLVFPCEELGQKLQWINRSKR